MSRPEAGARINNYLLDERIGSGSFGEVWKAHHHIFNDTVAIKIPTDPQYVRHLQREGMAIHGLRDANIVRAIDLDPYADPPYLIMEYVDGPSLRKLIDAHPGGLPIDPAVAVLEGVLRALEVAHAANVVHRDVKPANILISGGDDLTRMTPNRVKVTDFGLGHLSEATRESMMQSGSIQGEAGRSVAGTLAYMAPEQRDGQPVDPRSDLYSVGIVLHEMLTGVLPQGSDRPSAIRENVPRWLDRVFERCYTRRERRYETASQMRNEIGQYWSPPAWVLGDGAPQMRTSGTRWSCMHCSGRVDAGDQFCIHCGRQLVDHVPRCPSCHAFVGRGDNYCILCGKDLRMMA